MYRPLIPENAIGRVGMIAALHHVRGEDDGRLVAVQHPIGMVTELIGARMPVFAWQVLVLGEPVDVNANHCRETPRVTIVVAPIEPRTWGRR